MAEHADASERLRILEEALRFAQIGLYRYRFDGTVLDMNEAAFEILGLAGHFASPAAVLGHSIEGLLIYTGPHQRVRSLIRSRGEARNILYPFRTLDGVEKWVVHNSFPVRLPSGEEVVQAIVKDVTADHLREQALRQSEERLARIVETLTEAIVMIDTQGRFTFANAAAERILGLSVAQVLARTIDDPAWHLTTLRGEPYAGEVQRLLQVVRTGAPVYGMEIAIRKADGQRILLSVNAAPLRDSGGNVVEVVASLTDITEQKRLERLRDDFLSAAAHELKTPVATIKGYAQLLQQWAPGGHDTREGAAFDIIVRQSDRLNRLVQALLDFTRLQEQNLELHYELFDLGDLAEEVVARRRVTAPLPLVLKREALAPVNADRDRVDQILSNLLDNAIKASTQGTEVTVTVSASEAMAMAAVSDRGVGIPADQQAHIYERFYRARGNHGYERGGMGMGLYLGREIIERHGGHIWFESTWGQGTTFHISLPLAERIADGGTAGQCTDCRR
jgi:two-component system, OmpR family, phosphate regulon sensor histidine kinase PhoR